MTGFERNQLSLIDKRIDEVVKHPTVGVINQVYEHSNAEDDSNWEVDVELDGGTRKEQKCPLHSAQSGSINAPRKGDKVLVFYTEGKAKRPVAMGIGWSNQDRPPVGVAGINRDEYESGPSPAGEGNVYVNSYTSYSDTVASNDKRDLDPEEVFIQIAKHTADENIDPSEKPDLPAKIEMYDSPTSVNDQSWISVEINKEDGADSEATWGMKFNIKTGEWKIVGPKGFGIESDGEGNFTWHHKDITFNEVDGPTGPLDL